jgi:SH3 domain-containing YSC84-like protein 1
VMTGAFGSGLVVLKDAKTGKWSAPAAVAAVGGGVGPQAGWDVTDVVLFFKSESGAAADAWKGNYQLAAGVSGGVAFGPFGRHASWEYHLRLGSKQLALAFALSYKKGFYLGSSVDVQLVKSLNGRNQAAYGPTASLEDILSGKVAAPADAKPLLAALERFVSQQQ